MLITVHSPVAHVWFYLCTIGALLVLATYTWQFHKTPGAKQQVYVQLSKAAWLVFLVMAGISTELPDKLFWINLQLMAAALSPYYWFVFGTRGQQTV